MLVKVVLLHKNSSNRQCRIAQCVPADIPETRATAPLKHSYHASFVLPSCEELFCFAIGQSHATQDPPRAYPPGTGLDSRIVYQEGQMQILDGEEAPSIELSQLQHPQAPSKYHASDEGISHFDDDDAPQSYVQKQHEARQSVGQGNRGALQASLPVGVSMTIDSSQ